jgi:F0F1-type ATP synthase assembly protein I
MAEKIKPTIEDLQRRLEDMEKMSEKYKTMLEERIRSKPLESAGMIFIGGIVLGVLIGAAVSRRS